MRDSVRCGAMQEVVKTLTAANSVCVIGHVRPDADAIGSVSALRMGLERMGKDAVGVVGQRHPIPEALFSIPGAEEIEVIGTLPQGYDLYVTVDCGDLSRTGSVATEIAKLADAGRVICIDHHASNAGFGSINLMDYEAESTTVVLYSLLEALKVPLDRNIAHALYAGLVTDTGSFRWGQPKMHRLAEELLHFGLDPKQIAVDLLDSLTADDLQMLGRVLAQVSLVDAGRFKLAILVADHDVIAHYSDHAVEFLVDYVRALRGTDMGVVFKEQAPGYWATSLRSSAINCADIATLLGGGGHIPAAGYLTTGSLPEIVDELVAVVSTL
ncbi:MAG: bifunctional oligoribonuclease/PAP phosphatase NrnA [Corynebacterium sp.]|nr:bifunctional oligoribonuclease/PAP phosphatase NrnA [Corynebacterium sp.]